MGLVAESLAKIFAQPDERIDLGVAVSTLGLVAYPDLDIEASLEELDFYADGARVELERMEPSESPDRVISAINRAMFDVCGLHGNRESYYDPRNSFLDQVFRRRTGLPITLSVIYMEVGRRLDFDVFGVGLPGHFVVKYYRGKREVFVDPFHEGRILNRQGCRRLIKTLHGRPVELRDLDFAACDKRSIVLRMCRNLRDVYLSTRQYRRGIEIVDAILALEPEDFEDLKVRAWINYELGRRKQSLDDLERYRAAGGGADLEDVDRWERNLRQALAQMN